MAGAILFAGAEVVRQNFAIALGLQDSFSWSDVGKQAIIGALTAGAGVAGGIAETAEVGSRIYKIAKISQTVLNTSAAAVRSIDDNGRITNWSGIALASLKINSDLTGKFANTMQAIESRSQYISPWLNLAETAVREGELTTDDWVSAIGNTLSAVVDSNIGTTTNSQGNTVPGSSLAAVASRSATKTLIGGATALVDDEAAFNYFANAVGNEVGNFIGGTIIEAIETRQAEIRTLKQNLDYLDRYYQLSEDERNTLMQEGLAGKLTPNYQLQEGLAENEGANAKYKEGVVTLDKDQVALAETDRQAASDLYGRYREDTAHAIAERLEELRGIEDLRFDEGGLVGANFVKAASRAAGDGDYTFTADFGNGRQSFTFGSAEAINTLNKDFTLERILQDVKVNGAEYQMNENSLEALRTDLMSDSVIGEYMSGLSDAEREEFIQNWADTRIKSPLDLILDNADREKLPIGEMRAPTWFDKYESWRQNSTLGQIYTGLGEIAEDTLIGFKEGFLMTTDTLGNGIELLVDNAVPWVDIEYKSESALGQSIEAVGYIETGKAIAEGVVTGIHDTVKAVEEGDARVITKAVGGVALSLASSQALKIGKVPDSTYPNKPVNIESSAGRVIGEYVEGSYLKINSKKKSIYGGNTIQLSSDKTTTITGRLNDVNTVAVRGENLPGLTLMGENKGGINILRSPKWNKIQEKHLDLKAIDESAYWNKVTDEFWETANKPWLEDAMKRNDNFRFVSDPNKASNIYQTVGKKFVFDSSGNRIKSIFGREIDYLKANGYEILADGTAVKK